MYPYNHKRGQKIQTDAVGVSVDHAFLAHYPIPAASASAESDAGVMALTALAAEAATISAGFTNPAVPRNVKVDCNKAGITSDVVVHGTNFAGEEIEETIALNGQTAVAGTLAFATITAVDLPALTNTPAYQVATVAVTQGAQGAGSTVFTFVSAATGAAFDVTVAFAVGDDTTAEAAVKLRAGLNANSTFAAKWTAGGTGADIVLTAKQYAAQDATINLTVKTAGVSAITLGAITVNTTAGVAEDKVSVGLGKSFGLPYMLPSAALVIAKLFNQATDSGTVTADTDEIEKNVIALAGTPDGLKPIDLYIIV